MLWDYSKLAKSYLKRAPYSKNALDKLYGIIKSDCKQICDIGAGTGFLSKELASRGFIVTSIEPNDEMRKYGIQDTQNVKNIIWKKAAAEETFEKENYFDAVTYGSSFNVVDKDAALREAHRIVKSKGWFSCMWNHRDLHDPLQEQIEDIIKKHIPEYSYGSRREDQSDVLKQSNLFSSVEFFSNTFIHKYRKEDVFEAWQSHGTLHRQAKEKFSLILDDIKTFLDGLNKEYIEIPYETKIWVAQFK